MTTSPNWIWVFRYAVVATATVLGLLALNRVGEAGVAVIIAAVLAVILAIVKCFSTLPPSARERIGSRRALRILGIKCISAAVLIASAYWAVSLLPVPGSVAVRQVVFAIYRLFDFVPSAFALLLPVDWRSGFHQYFRSATYCFPGPLWWETVRYVRTAAPAYALVFFGIAFTCKVVRAGIHERRPAA